MSSLKVLYAYSKGLRKYFVAAILFVIIETSFEVIIPLLMSDIIDIGIVQKDTSVFIEKGIQMMICALLSLICGLLYARYASKAITLYGEKLRSIQYAKIQEYAFINLDHFETSSLITRLTSDVTVIQNSLINGIRPFARGPVILLLGLVMSFIIKEVIILSGCHCHSFNTSDNTDIKRKIIPERSRKPKIITENILRFIQLIPWCIQKILIKQFICVFSE